jgi:hypothetical protein
MRRPATRPDRAPLSGPAAWFIRFAGLNGIICPLGFGAFTIPSILSVAGGSGIVYVWGTQFGDHVGGQPYGSAPLELTATRATVLLLMTGFIGACLVQLAGGNPADPPAAVGIRRPARRDAAQRGLLVGIRPPARLAQRSHGAPGPGRGVAWCTEELHASCRPKHLPSGRAGLGEEAVDKAGPVLLQLCPPG